MITFLRNNNNWLKHRAYKAIREDHPIFEKEGFIVKTLNYCFDEKRWWLAGLILATLFFSLPFVPFHWINVLRYDSEGRYYNIIDQRVANTVTLISVMIAIVAFLLANLAIKEPNSYKMMAKKTLLFPTIYFILGTAVSFLFLSLLRDYYNNGQFSRAVTTGTYFLVLSIIFAGALFRRLFLFTNSSYIISVYSKEAIRELKAVMMKALIHNYSRKILEQEMQAGGLQPVNRYNVEHGEHTVIVNATEEIEVGQFYSFEVVDVNLRRVRHILRRLRKHDWTGRYVLAAIGSYTSPNQVLFWFNGNLTRKTSVFSKMSSAFFFKKVTPNTNAKSPTAVVDALNSSIKSYAKDGNDAQIGVVLDVYYEMYKTLIKIRA